MSERAVCVWQVFSHLMNIRRLIRWHNRVKTKNGEDGRGEKVLKPHKVTIYAEMLSNWCWTLNVCLIMFSGSIKKRKCFSCLLPTVLCVCFFTVRYREVSDPSWTAVSGVLADWVECHLQLGHVSLISSRIAPRAWHLAGKQPSWEPADFWDKL